MFRTDVEYHKYLKYKTKYLELKMFQNGGSKKSPNKLSINMILNNPQIRNIIKLIKKSPITTIINELPNLLSNVNMYCDQVIGNGMMGEVIVPKIGETFRLLIGNSLVLDLPIVVKNAHIEGKFNMKIINNKLYIYAYKNITTEALILCYITDLWYKKKSPHLPNMIGFSSCKQNTVNKIITERHGLHELHGLYGDGGRNGDGDRNGYGNGNGNGDGDGDRNGNGYGGKILVKVDANKYFTDDPLFHPMSLYNSEHNQNLNYETYLSTMTELFRYIIQGGKAIGLPPKWNDNDDTMESKLSRGNVVQSNIGPTFGGNIGVKYDIIKLCDYLTISFLHTYHILAKNNIYLHDMHAENIFIHWLCKNSYMGDKYIGNIKKVVYIVNKNKYLEIETYGMLLKIGDCGSSIVCPRDDVYILGQGNDLEKTYKIVDQLVKPNFGCYYFLYAFQNLLPFRLYEKTIAHKILSSPPYSEIPMASTYTYEFVDSTLTPLELLDKYCDEYMINHHDIEEHNTLIVGV